MKEYRNVGDHVYDLASGQMVGVGESVNFSKDDEEQPHNKRLIESGAFIEVPKVDKKSSAKTKEGDEE